MKDDLQKAMAENRIDPAGSDTSQGFGVSAQDQEKINSVNSTEARLRAIASGKTFEQINNEALQNMPEEPITEEGSNPWVSDNELKYGSGWDEAKNTMAGMLDNFTKQIGNIATAPHQITTMVNEAFTDEKSRNAYLKYQTEGPESLTQEDWDALGTNAEKSRKEKGFFQDVVIDSIEGIPGLNLLLQPFKSDFDRLADNDEIREQAKQVKDYIQTDVGNDFATRNITEGFDKVFEDRSEQMDALAEDIAQGDYASFIKSVEGLIPGILADAAKVVGSNKLEALKLAAEESPDILLNLFGAGVALSGMESTGRAGDFKTNALKAFKERTGKAPNSKELAQINGAAAAYGALDFLGEMLPAKGTGKLLSKLSSQFASGAKEGTVKALGKVAAKTASSGVAGAVEEGVAELGQGVLEGVGDLSKLTGEELKSAGKGSLKGAVAGGTLGAGIESTRAVKPLAEKASEVKEKIDTKIAEAKTQIPTDDSTVEGADNYYNPVADKKYKEAVDLAASDTDEGKELYKQSLDPENKEVSPAIAIDALKKKVESADDVSQVISEIQSDLGPAMAKENELMQAELQKFQAEEARIQEETNNPEYSILSDNPEARVAAERHKAMTQGLMVKAQELSQAVSKKLNPDTPTTLNEAVPNEKVAKVGSNPQVAADNVAKDVQVQLGTALGSGPKIDPVAFNKTLTNIEKQLNTFIKAIAGQNVEPKTTEKLTKLQEKVKLVRSIVSTQEDALKRGYTPTNNNLAKKGQRKGGEQYANTISSTLANSIATGKPLPQGDVGTVRKNLTDLLSFTRSRVTKATTFSNVMENGGSDQDKANLEIFSKIKKFSEKTDQGYKIHKNSTKLVSAIQQEAAQLQMLAAKALAEIAAHPDADTILKDINTSIEGYEDATDILTKGDFNDKTKAKILGEADTPSKNPLPKKKPKTPTKKSVKGKTPKVDVKKEAQEPDLPPVPPIEDTVDTPPVQEEEQTSTDVTAPAQFREGKSSLSESLLIAKKTYSSTADFLAEFKEKGIQFVRSNIKEITFKNASDALINLNVINPIKQWYKSKSKDPKSALQTVPDFFNTVREGIKEDQSTELNKALHKLTEIEAEFVEAFKQVILEPTVKDGRISPVLTDLVHALSSDKADGQTIGEFDPNVLSTIAMGAYDYLTTEATGTLYNTDADLHKILGSKNDKAPISDEAKQYLSDLGITQNHLAERLGKVIVNMLNLSPTEDIPLEKKSAFQNSLGAAAILMLEETGYITRNEVPTELYGLLKKQNQGIEVDSELIHAASKSKEGNVTFYQVKTNSYKKTLEPSKRVNLAIDSRKELNKHDWYKTFIDPDRPPKTYRLEAPKGKKRQAGKGIEKFDVSRTASDKLNNYEQIPWIVNQSAFATFQKMTLHQQRAMLGYAFEEDFEKAHIRDHSTLEGKNLTIDRAIEAVNDFIAEVEESDTSLQNTEIFFTSSFWSNFRNGIDSTTINPQAEKLHRFLFSQKDWTFKAKGNRKAAYLAIGLGLGLEPAKKGGQKKVIKAVQDMVLNKDYKYQDAINVIKYEDSNYSPEEWAVIQEAIDDMGEKAHSFAALVTMAQIQKDGDAATIQLPNEVDGLTNGPAISMLQMLSDKDQITNQMFNKFGFFLDQEEGASPDIDKMLAEGMKDAYTEVAEKADKHIEAEFAKRNTEYAVDKATWAKDKSDKGVYARMMQNLNWINTDRVWRKIHPDSIKRAMIKYPLMFAIYGSGMPTLQKAVATEVIEDFIYKPLTSFIETDADGKEFVNIEKVTEHANLVKEALADHSIKTKSGKWINTVKLNGGVFKIYKDKEGKVVPFPTKNGTAVTPAMLKQNPNIVRHMILAPGVETALKESFQKHVGVSIAAAIKEAYVDQINNRTILNSGVANLTKTVNKIYQSMYEERRIERNKDILSTIKEEDFDSEKQFKKKKKDVGQYLNRHAGLSQKDNQEILEQLKQMFPKVQLSFSEKGDPDTYKGMFKQDTTAEFGSDFALAQRTIQMTKGNIHNKRIDSDILSFKDMGVAPMVVSVQAVDGSVMLDNIGKKHLASTGLNVHDAKVANATKMNEVSRSINGSFLYQNQKYSISEAFTEAINTGVKEIDQLGQEDLVKYGVALPYSKLSEEDQNIAFDMMWNNYSTGGMSRLDVQVILEEMDYSMMDIMRESNDRVQRVNQGIQEAREEIFSRMTHMLQFAHTGGHFENETLFKDKAKENDSFLTSMRMQIEKDTEDFLSAAGIDGNFLGSSPVGSNRGGPEYVETLSDDVLDQDRLRDPSVKDIASKVSKADFNSIMSTIFNLEEHTDIQTDFEHQEYLKSLVRKIQGSLPRELYFNAHIRSEGDTRGEFYPEANLVSVRVSTGAKDNYLTPSAGEVLGHELSHAVTYEALMKFPELARSVGDFLQFLKDNGFTHEFFLPQDRVPTEEEIEIAKTKFDYFTKYNTDTRVDRMVEVNGEQVPYAHVLAEFVAYGMTNAQVRKKLATMDGRAAKRGTKNFKKFLGKNLQDTLVNIFTGLMNAVIGRFNRLQQKGNALDEFDSLAHALYHTNVKGQGAIEKGMKAVENKIQDKLDYVNTRGNAFFKTLKFMGQISAVAVPPIGSAIDKARDYVNSNRNSFVTSIVQQMRGVTPKTRELTSLLRRAKDDIDSAYIATRNNVIRGVNKLFREDLEEKDSVSLTKVLMEADVAYLFDKYTPTQIKTFIRLNNTALDSEIGRLVTRIRDLAPRDVNYIMQQSKALAFYMKTQRSTVELLDKNAMSIMKDVESSDQDALEEAIDTYVSLLALKGADPEYRRNVHFMMDDQHDAVVSLVRHINEAKKKSRSVLFADNPFSMTKGYVPTTTNPTKGMVYASRKFENELLAQGYVRSNETVQRDRYDKTNDTIYVYTLKNVYANDMQSGIFQLKNPKTKGFKVAGDVHNAATPNISSYEDTITLKKRAARRSANPSFDPTKVVKNYMIPTYDSNGEVKDLGYEITKEHSDKYLEATYFIDNKLGTLTGKIVTFNKREDLNVDAIEEFKKYYLKERSEGTFKEDNYMRIGPGAEGKAGEFWAMLPYAAREEVKRICGNSGMPVPKKLADMAFGYRKISISDFLNTPGPDRKWYHKIFVGLAEKMFGDKLARGVRVVESVLRELTSMAKNNIIVKNFLVTVGNYMSNVAHLRSMGITFPDIIKGLSKSKRALLQYQKAQDTVDQIKFEIFSKDLAESDPLYTELNEKKQRAINVMAMSPVKHMIDAHLVPNIVDDIEVGEVGKVYPGYLGKYLGKIGEYADKISPSIKKIGGQVFMSEDTSIYSMANNAVKITDFSARYVMYEHITKGRNAVSHEEAIATIEDEFINFNLPTHKTLQYLNDIGLLWFTNYFLGVQKVILKMFTERPANAILSMLTTSALDMSTIYDGLPLINKDMLSFWGNPFRNFKNSVMDIFTLNAATEPFA